MNLPQTRCWSCRSPVTLMAKRCPGCHQGICPRCGCCLEPNRGECAVQQGRLTFRLYHRRWRAYVRKQSGNNRDDDDEDGDWLTGLGASSR